MKIRLINGPNINMLGKREPTIYGNETYDDLCEKILNYAKEKDVSIDIFQSNSEGDIITDIQETFDRYDAIIINPAAYTHTSIGILDALKAVGLPTVEVHISNVMEREDFRKVSYVSYVAKKTIHGHGTKGYLMAIDYLIEQDEKR